MWVCIQKIDLVLKDPLGHMDPPWFWPLLCCVVTFFCRPFMFNRFHMQQMSHSPKSELAMCNRVIMPKLGRSSTPFSFGSCASEKSILLFVYVLEGFGCLYWKYSPISLSSEIWIKLFLHTHWHWNLYILKVRQTLYRT